MLEFTNLKLLKLLKISNNILQEIELSLNEDLVKFNFKVDLSLDCKNFYKSMKKNFFTLLMISILQQEKIDRKRIIKYGKIILFLRQIVTSVDNMLDKENKGIISIKGLENPYVSNSLIMLLCEKLLTQTLNELGDKDFLVNKKITNFIYEIAYGENIRTYETIEPYMNSNDIIERIHSNIGGKLLELSLLAPMTLESDQCKNKLKEYSASLFYLGMALQNLDDYYDIKEDFNNKKYNLYIAKLLENYKFTYLYLEEKDIQSLFYRDLDSIFKNTYYSFKLLKELGYPLEEKDGKKLLKKLFILRGMKEEHPRVIEYYL
ncbi:MAG: hypothetical protein ACRCRV_05565 [Cetobacterium sp.]